MSRHWRLSIGGSDGDGRVDSLKAALALLRPMDVLVEVVGDETYELEAENATYADLLAEIDLSPHEVSVMVDGSPVPEDQPVEADRVKVLRLIRGG